MTPIVPLTRHDTTTPECYRLHHGRLVLRVFARRCAPAESDRSDYKIDTLCTRLAPSLLRSLVGTQTFVSETGFKDADAAAAQLEKMDTNDDGRISLEEVQILKCLVMTY